MNQQAKRIKELFGYARTLTKEQGIGTMCVRAAGFFKRRFFGKRARYWPSNMALEAQRSDPAAETFPIISILTPLYNTPQNFLTEFLDSVENQTAHNWQLCLADASDDAHTYVGELVQKHVAANPRIRYVKIENKGIAANTNAAARLAQGEYLALADHDDILAPHAIYCMGKELQKTGADFAYSDEALFRKSPKTAHVAHFKPDYAPEYLMACNYICHLAVFRKSLFDAIGGERPECDGAQDHDLFLRLIDAMQAKDAAAYPAGAVLLAGSCGVHLRRHRGQALCGKSRAESRGGPPGGNRPQRQGRGGHLPWYLPCAVGTAGAGTVGVHPDPQQGPCGRPGKMSVQPVLQNAVRSV